jgi:protein-S-isoprenylcysteine O-methyltransferase Ste14
MEREGSANLLLRAAFSLLVVLALTAAALFASAGRLDYWQAWLFLANYATCSVLCTAYLWRRDRALLERRMRGGPTAEGEPAQKLIMLFASACFIALLVVPALDHRWNGAQAGTAVVLFGNALVVLGFFLVLLVFRANTFAAATVKVTSDQKVISTGPYAIVRHPMYAGSLPLLFGIPLALGSFRGLAPLALMLAALIWRLLDEERVLRKNLPGYAEYQAKVRWRLFPGIF